MNRSWTSRSSNSSGFVYFNTSSDTDSILNQSNPRDSADFLAFTDSPQRNHFDPSHYSSPQFKNRDGRWRGGQKNFRNYKRRPNDTYQSFNNSRSFNQSYDSPRTEGQEKDYTKFLHPSFTEDPWAVLEKKLKDGIQEKSVQEDESEEET